jgi:serine/threonine protein kinase
MGTPSRKIGNLHMLTFLRWHQDIKPENILQFRTGPQDTTEHGLKLADFGLMQFQPAGASSSNPKHKTKTWRVLTAEFLLQTLYGQETSNDEAFGDRSRIRGDAPRSQIQDILPLEATCGTTLETLRRIGQPHSTIWNMLGFHFNGKRVEDTDFQLGKPALKPADLSGLEATLQLQRMAKFGIGIQVVLLSLLPKLSAIGAALPSLCWLGFESDIGERALRDFYISIAMLIYAWITTLTEALLSSVLGKKSRTRVHGSQAMLLSMLLLASPTTASPLVAFTPSPSASILEALSHELSQICLVIPSRLPHIQTNLSLALHHPSRTPPTHDSSWDPPPQQPHRHNSHYAPLHAPAQQAVHQEVPRGRTPGFRALGRAVRGRYPGSGVPISIFWG